jgi:kynureninase
MVNDYFKRSYAKKMDENDDIYAYRERFYLKKDEYYMDGNSCGLLSKDAEKTLERVLNEWKEYGIDCWTKPEHQLFIYQDYLGELLSPIINAKPNEITVHSSTTINIHTAIATFYKPTKDKYKILVDDINFPTDRYAIDSQIKLKGLKPSECVKIVESRDGKMIYEDDFIEAMTEDVAIIFLPSVLYRSGQLVNMEKITKAAKEKGIIVGWDMCHSVGVVNHDFNALQPDFAVFCTYKYLNGGPGSPAGLYINEKHFNMEPGLTGWHGNVKETQFNLSQTFESASNAGGWQTGTQHILSMAPLEGSLKMINEVGIEKLREKSLKLTKYMMDLADEKLTKFGFKIGNPREDEIRGGHVALEHEEAMRINETLKANKVIPDFRFPNVVRFAPVPLYVSFEDVYDVIQIIEKIMINKEYEKFSKKRGIVA